jgi:hypothetical protein
VIKTIGAGLPTWLGATRCASCGTKDQRHGEPYRLRLAYLVLLRAEIARFT